VLLVDLLKELQFSDAEIDEMIAASLFNALFVLGRSISLIGHYLDPKRPKSELYRHCLDDIFYSIPGLAKRARGRTRCLLHTSISVSSGTIHSLVFSVYHTR